MSKESESDYPAVAATDNSAARDNAGGSDQVSGEARAAEQNDIATELQALKSKLDETEKLYLRSQAELENFRKRMRREMEDERRYANLPLMRDLLTVVDNIQRAIEAAQTSEEKSGLLEGVNMVAGQLATILERYHCKRIEALGKSFDPNLHEAIGQEPSETHPANTVTREMQAGFQLHGRVIRPATVFVSLGPENDNA
jgi:molecular chaperone GrpE